MAGRQVRGLTVLAGEGCGRGSSTNGAGCSAVESIHAAPLLYCGAKLWLPNQAMGPNAFRVGNFGLTGSPAREPVQVSFR